MDKLDEIEGVNEDAGFLLYCFRLVWLFFEQVLLMCQKHVGQKQRNGRQFWKDSIMIQFFLLSFVTWILFMSSQPVQKTDFYGKIQLPPLSTTGPTGIFDQNAVGNSVNTFVSKRLFYTPSNHAGVQSLVHALTTKYPNIDAVGAASYDEILNLYQENLFDTWAAIVFELDDAQTSSDKLVPTQSSPTTVSYSILVNPINWAQGYTTGNFTDGIYNKASTSADLFWSSGYMTLQNFVGTYLATQYDGVSADYTVRLQ
jgi:hypothetical protein